MPQSLGKTKNGLEVLVDLERGHAATHLRDTPGLLEMVKEAIPNIEPDDSYRRIEIDLGREVGYSDLVETEDGDEIVYAKRPHRDAYTRFVKNKGPVPSSWITLELQRKDEQHYELFTAYIGRIVPSFPGTSFETFKSKPFWSRHALVWGRQEVVLGTETTECPW
jgi:hypothetical protein